MSQISGLLLTQKKKDEKEREKRNIKKKQGPICLTVIVFIYDKSNNK